MDGPLAFAEALLAHPTVPFHEEVAAQHCVKVAGELGIAVERDAAGNVVLRRGRRSDAPLVLVAHLDHPGFVVDDVEGDRVAMTFHGGLAASHAIEGSPVDFFRAGDHTGRGALVTVDETSGRLTGADAEVLDGEVSTDGIAMWGFPAWSIDDRLITARVCDDLLGVAAILACMAQATGDAPVVGLLTRGEEVGFLGTLEAIRLGTVPPGASVISLECSKALVNAPQGDGVIVRVGDRMSVFAPALTDSLRLAAERAGVAHQRKLMDGGACEATAFCASGYRASGLAVALGNYHNASDDEQGVAPETVCVDDWLAEVELLVALVEDPSLLDETPDPPQWLQERAAVAREKLGAG